MKPLIGVSCNFDEREQGKGQCTVPAAYVDAVQAAGGVPVIVPQLHVIEDVCDVLGRLSGMIFTGGADMRPDRYGEELHPKTKLISERREDSDFMWVMQAIKRDMPVLAICYGCQLLNVAFGGTLYQDVPDQLNTETVHSGEGAMHEVTIVKGTKLFHILGTSGIEANSSHHQAVKAVNAPVIVSAQSGDGVIEAIESTRHRLMLGIQWHPERLTDREPHLALFEALVEEAAGG